MKRTKPAKKVSIGNLTSRVVGVFLIISLLVGGFGYISYKSFESLNNSVRSLASSKETSEQLNELFREMMKAENLIRIYIITEDDSTLAAYEVMEDSIKTGLVELKNEIGNDPVRGKKVETLALLYDQKQASLDEFLELKLKEQSNAYAEKALKELNLDGKNKNQFRQLQSKSLVSKSDSLVAGDISYRLVEREKQTKGIIASLKKLFGSKEVVYDTIPILDPQSDPMVESTGSGYVKRMVDGDSLVNKIEEILTDLRAEEKYFRNLLSLREYRILEQDQNLFFQIQETLNELTTLEKAENLKKQEEAEIVADEATKTLFTIGIIGLLGSGILLTLVFRGVSKSNFYRQKAELERNRAERLAKIKEEFLANMSHEIRTPIHSINGFLGLLQETQLDEEQIKYLSTINGSASFLLRLVNDLLDISKLNAGKVTLHIEGFYPHKMLEEIINSFIPLAEDKGIELIFDYQAADDLALETDVFRFRQIITNLLSNAIKFTEEGYVRLTFAWLDQYEIAKIHITDTGIGMTPDEQRKVFMSFSQADSSITRKYGGTGLGLTIVKNLVELFDGAIDLTSIKGKGSTFTLRIPMHKPEVKPSESYLISDHESNFIGKLAAVVDDDPNNRLLMSKILQSIGFDVKVFENPVYFLESIKNESYYFVFSDIQMPEMDGLTLSEKLRDSYKGSFDKLVAMTAKGESRPDVQENKANFDGILFKPFSRTELINLIYDITEIEPEIKDPIESVNDKVGANESTEIELDISEIKMFAGNDPEMIRNMIEGLYGNMQNDLSNFTSFANNKDLNSLMKLSHRMIPSWSHFSFDTVSKNLRTLEETIESNPEPSDEINEMANELIEEMSVSLALIDKWLRRQSHIA
ncbi:ATP-binding protein [Marinigracilibium pacificum]|uniref:histidine kinase n=1 Tax=Marinigracilibium pacificum TaxID=2729599 RepID=A0A848J1C3_9BACT|nr:ATP-binding protein [Marinigracilibium pacificum]NMM49471.1 response regulator [Marinigracilibium pacificum]